MIIDYGCDGSFKLESREHEVYIKQNGNKWIVYSYGFEDKPKYEGQLNECIEYCLYNYGGGY